MRVEKESTNITDGENSYSALEWEKSKMPVARALYVAIEKATCVYFYAYYGRAERREKRVREAHNTDAHSYTEKASDGIGINVETMCGTIRQKN